MLKVHYNKYWHNVHLWQNMAKGHHLWMNLALVSMIMSKNVFVLFCEISFFSSNIWHQHECEIFKALWCYNDETTNSSPWFDDLNDVIAPIFKMTVLLVHTVLMSLHLFVVEDRRGAGSQAPPSSHIPLPAFQSTDFQLPPMRKRAHPIRKIQHWCKRKKQRRKAK